MEIDYEDSEQSTNGNDEEIINDGTDDILDESREVIYIFTFIFSQNLVFKLLVIFNYISQLMSIFLFCIQTCLRSKNILSIMWSL